MKKIELIKRSVFVLSGLSLIVLFTFCDNTNENSNTDESDTTVIQEVKKTREELIVNRDTMYIKDIDNPNVFEQRHTPDIIIGETNEENLTAVNIKMGINGIVHPSEEGHWIDYLAVYLDGTLAEKKEAENGPGSNDVNFLLDLRDIKEIKVEAGCNLHGIWFNSKSLIK